MTSQATCHALPQRFPARRATVMLLVAALLWGTGNVANKTILLDLDPFAAVVLRNVIAGLALLPLVWLERPRLTRGWVASILPVGLMFAGATVLQQWGYQTATVTNASFLVNATCVLTPLLSLMFFGDRLRPLTLLSAALALLGALFMSGAIRSLATVTPGDLLCLASALFYAGWIIGLGRHVSAHGAPATATLAQCLLAALAVAPLMALAEPALPRNWAAALPEALYLGLFATAAAFALTAAAQQSVSSSTAAVLVSAESLFGAAGGIVVLGERPGPGVLLGAALMLVAITLISVAPEVKATPAKP